MAIVVCAGTKRGLFVFESRNRDRWTMRGPLLAGWQVFHAIVDTRGTPRLHAAGNSDSFGANTFSGDLRAKKLAGAKKPPIPPKAPPKALKLAKKWGISVAQRVWHVEPGPARERNVMYCGTAPAGLFRSTDAGKTWKELKSLSGHSSRKDWMPGAGGLATHSIQVDGNRIFVGISAAGSFRSDDAGKSWTPINRGVHSFEGGVMTGGVGT